LYYFYDMLTRTRNNIEEVLISYIKDSISKPAGIIVPASAAASSSTALPLPRSAAEASSSRALPLSRSAAASSSTALPLPRSAAEASSYRALPLSRSAAASSSTGLPLPRSAAAASSTVLQSPRSSVTMLAIERDKLYKQQLAELSQLHDNGNINGQEYFDTKLALSKLALSNGIPIDMVTRSILAVMLEPISKNGFVYYKDTKDNRLFRIYPNPNRVLRHSIGPIYKRIYLQDE